MHITPEPLPTSEPPADVPPDEHHPIQDPPRNPSTPDVPDAPDLPEPLEPPLKLAAATAAAGVASRAPPLPDAVKQVSSDNAGGEKIVDADEKQLAQQQRSLRRAEQEQRDRDLDAALDDTFAASDPVNLTPEKPEKFAKEP